MRIHIQILPFLFSMSIWAQSGMNPCNRNISTNPSNPFNDEWIAEFPGKTAHFTNTGFTWYPPGFGATITIDKTQNWATPYAAQSGVISMLSPFVDDNQRGTDYLQQGDVEFRDWHWEDGWELLWMNLGIYPNGDKINDPTNANHWLGAGLSWDPTPNNAPYFVLYNRYKGVLRVFANIWFKDPGVGTVDDVIVTLVLDGSEIIDQSDNESYSGVFRLVNGIDKTLDQKTDIIEQSSPRRHPAPNGFTPQGVAMNTNQWVAADFQIAYDPCQCYVPTKLNIYFETREEMKVDLAIRSISYDKDLNQLNEAEKDYFQTMLDAEGNVIAPGNVAYASIDSLLADYKKALDKYNSDLKDYKSPINILKKGVVDLVKTGVSSGVVSPIGVSSDLIKFIAENQLPLWSDETDKEAAKEFAKDVTKSGKKIIADQFDFLNVAMNIQDKPTKPQVPQATFTEGRIAGEIKNTYYFGSGNLRMPGTVFTANSDIHNFSPYNIPAYNNVMGMFAVMKTPELRFYNEESVSDNVATQYFQSWEEPYQGTYVNVKAIYNSSTDLNFMLPNGLSYAINEALDWDEEKTSFLVSFQLEFKNKNISSYHAITLGDNANFEIIHQLKDSQNNLTTVVASEYYRIDEIKNKLFSLSVKNDLDLESDLQLPNWVNEGDPEIIEAVNEWLAPFLIGLATELKSIKMKVIADMYFDQIAYPTDPSNPKYSGEQVNTFQVRTFELYNKDKEGTLEEQLRGEIVEEYQSWANYLPGTTVLDGEIAHDDPRVIEIDHSANTPVLIIRAENVEVVGDVGPESGYDLRIEAMTDIK